jgi:hypothetical protein
MLRKIPITQDEVVRYAESCDEDEIVEIVQAWAMEQQRVQVEAEYEAATERVLERIEAVFDDVPRLEENVTAFADPDMQDKFKGLPIEQQDKINPGHPQR